MPLSLAARKKGTSIGPFVGQGMHLSLAARKKGTIVLGLYFFLEAESSQPEDGQGSTSD